MAKSKSGEVKVKPPQLTGAGSVDDRHSHATKRQSILADPQVRQRRRDQWWRVEWSAVRRIEKTDYPTHQDVFQATWVLRPTELKRVLRSKPNHCKRQWPRYVRAIAGLPSLAQSHDPKL